MILNPNIECAYEASDYVKVVELLGQDLSQVLATTSSESTLLHKAIMGERTWLAAELLKLGMNINALDQHGRTPLHEACYYGKRAMVEFLVEQGANLASQDHDGATPLMRAASSSVGDRPVIAQYLLARGATADLATAVRLGRIDLVQQHLTKDAECVRHHPKSTNLITDAVICQGTELLELLMLAGARVNSCDAFGWHPLAYACYIHGQQVNAELVRVLLDHGANPNVDIRPAQLSLLRYSQRVTQRSDVATLLRKYGAREE